MSLVLSCLSHGPFCSYARSRSPWSCEASSGCTRFSAARQVCLVTHYIMTRVDNSKSKSNDSKNKNNTSLLFSVVWSYSKRFQELREKKKRIILLRSSGTFRNKRVILKTMDSYSHIGHMSKIFLRVLQQVMGSLAVSLGLWVSDFFWTHFSRHLCCFQVYVKGRQRNLALKRRQAGKV